MNLDHCQCTLGTVPQKKRKTEPQPTIEAIPWDSLYQRIQWLQRQLGLSARKFSLACGLSYNAIASLIAKKAEWCKPETAEAIARFSRCSLSWLKLGRGQPWVDVHSTPSPDYPDRKIAIAVASLLDVPASRIEKVLTLREVHARDPGLRYWLDRLGINVARDDDGTFSPAS